MRSGLITHYAEGYVERFTVTPCSEKLVTTHNVLLRIREDLGLGLLHASPAELLTHNNREKGDYSGKNLDMRTVYWVCFFPFVLCCCLLVLSSILISRSGVLRTQKLRPPPSPTSLLVGVQGYQRFHLFKTGIGI